MFVLWAASYQESGTVIPCTYKGQPVNYTAQMFLNDGIDSLPGFDRGLFVC